MPATEHNPTLSIMSQVGIREGRWQLKRKQLPGNQRMWESVQHYLDHRYQSNPDKLFWFPTRKANLGKGAQGEKKIISLVIMNKSDQESDCERRER